MIARPNVHFSRLDFYFSDIYIFVFCLLTIKNDITFYFIGSVYFGSSRATNSLKLEQKRKVDPDKILLMQISKKLFDQSEASISRQTNKY